MDRGLQEKHDASIHTWSKHLLNIGYHITVILTLPWLLHGQLPNGEAEQSLSKEPSCTQG